MESLKQRLSPIGYGAFKIGRNTGIKYESTYDLPGDVESIRLLNSIVDIGVTCIDTAPAYGLSEERIGKALAGRRHEFVLSTKVGEGYDNDRSTYDFSKEGMRESVERSLRRLRTEVIDLLWIHASHDDLRILRETDAVPAVVSLREAGLARAVGLSGYTGQAFDAASSWADAFMLEYSPEERSLETIIHRAHAGGIAVVVKKGLGSGRLPAEEAIRFSLSNPGVTSLVVGSLSLQHMRDNVRIARSIRPGGPWGGGSPTAR